MIHINLANIKKIKHSRSDCFALPTVLISSMVMLMVLLAAVTAVAATRTSLQTQHYNLLAKNASESGIAYARACLKANSVIPGAPQWTDAKPLTVSTNCSGDSLFVPACTDNSTDEGCSVVSSSSIVTNFSINKPPVDGDGKATSLSVPASTKLLSSSTSSVWRQYQNTSSYYIRSDISCPTGFIVVPGSDTYGTTDFCVMKYEAKRSSTTSNIPISVAAGTPWVSMSQYTAMANSTNVAGCTGCHLITEAEWMTIAQNVLSVASNWSSGTVGSGFIYSGNNDNVIDIGPGAALDANTNDTDGYYRTANVSPSNQKRTLTLTNGEVIWDFSGNVWEWTSGQSSQTIGLQPGIIGEYGAWRDYTAISNPGTLAINPDPDIMQLTGSTTWNAATNQIGLIYSNTEDISLRGFIRGSYWNWAPNVGGGVLGLIMNSDPSLTIDAALGFRVTRPDLNIKS